MANTDDPTEQLKTITNSLKTILKCPVCLETVGVPLMLCTNGHVFCCDCATNLIGCPECQAAFRLENIILVKNLLKIMPRLCRHSGHGCQQIVGPGSDHETFCGYRLVACKLARCLIKQPVCQLLNHCQAKHPNWLVINTIDKFLYWANFNPNDFRNGVHLVSLFGNLFWFYIKNDIKEKQLKISFQKIPNGQVENEYYVCVEFKQDIFVYSFTIKAFCIDDGDQIYCMKVPQDALHKLINEKGLLGFKLFFYKVSK